MDPPTKPTCREWTIFVILFSIFLIAYCASFDSVFEAPETTCKVTLPANVTSKTTVDLNEFNCTLISIPRQSNSWIGIRPIAFGWRFVMNCIFLQIVGICLTYLGGFKAILEFFSSTIELSLANLRWMFTRFSKFPIPIGYTKPRPPVIAIKGIEVPNNPSPKLFRF